MCPSAPASLSVWQLTHPAVRKTRLPAPTVALLAGAEGSSGGASQKAMATTAAAATTGIDQRVRPACRRLKKWRTYTPSTTNAHSTSQASSCP